MIRKSPTENSGIIVFRRHDEDIDLFIKRFKKKVNRSGILRELKNKSYYEKPSVYKRRKRNEAKSRRIKEQLKIERIENIKNKGAKNYDSGDK